MSRTSILKWGLFLGFLSVVALLGGTRLSWADDKPDVSHVFSKEKIPIPDWAMRPAAVTDSDKTEAAKLHTAGLDQFNQKEFEKAIDTLTQSVKLDPSQSKVWYDLARALREKAELVKAEESLTQAIQLDPDFREANELMSRVLCAEGKCGGGGGAVTR